MVTIHNRTRYALSFPIAALMVAATTPSNAFADPDPRMAEYKAQQHSTQLGVLGCTLLEPRESMALSDDEWAVAVQNQQVQRWVSCGHLHVAKDNSPAPHDPVRGSEADQGIRSMVAADAVELIAGVDDVQELKTIAELDGRKTVRAAVERRIRELGG